MASNLFNNLPLNTKRVYTRGIASSGCEIYIPVDSDNDWDIDNKKEALQYFLNNQFPSTPLTVA